jgi:hypothetical protein
MTIDEWQDPSTAATGPSSVPVIDLEPYFRGDPEGRAAVVDAVRAACEAHGFLVITGHGVPQASIDAIYSVSKEFFALPLEEKLACVGPSGNIFEAYAPLGASRDGGGPPSLVEMYHSSRHDTTEEAVANGYPREVASSMPVNVWPARPEDFAVVWQHYFREVEHLANRLLGLFAVALDLPEDWFADKIDRHLSNLAANCYPAQRTPPEPGQVRNNRQPRRHHGPLDQRPVGGHAAPRRQPAGRARAHATHLDPVLPPAEPRRGDRGDPDVRGFRQPAAVPARHRGRVGRGAPQGPLRQLRPRGHVIERKRPGSTAKRPSKYRAAADRVTRSATFRR